MSGTEVGLICGPEAIDELPRIEELGYDSVWTPEHILFHGPTPDALVTLGALAARTKRVKIGTAILLLPLRHPTVIAKAISWADVLSNGRVILGVGVGGEFPKEFEATGIPHHERGARSNDAIQVMKKLWTGEPVSHHSRFVNFDDATMKPKPVQPGGPPIVVAGRSEAAMRRAARLGDGYMPYLFDPQRYADSRAAIEKDAEVAGRDLSSFHWALYQFTCVAPTYEEARERANADLSRRYNMPFDKVVDRYCALGTPEQVAARLREFREAGARHFVLSPITAPGGFSEATDLFAREVVPGLKQG